MSFKHTTTHVNSVEEGIQQVRELAFTLLDCHMKRVLAGSGLYAKVDKPESNGPKASITEVIGILKDVIIHIENEIEEMNDDAK